MVSTKNTKNLSRKKLQRIRKATGITLDELAAASDLSKSMLSRFEAGQRELSSDAFNRLISEITSIADKKLLERIAQLEKENSILRGIAAAESNVAMCEKLPWMHGQLVDARARLAQKKLDQERFSRGNFDDPLIQEVIESHRKECEELAIQIRAMEAAAHTKEAFDSKAFVENFATQVSLRFGAAVLEGNRFEVDVVKKWKETGKTDFRVKIDSVIPVESDS